MARRLAPVFVCWWLLAGCQQVVPNGPSFPVAERDINQIEPLLPPNRWRLINAMATHSHRREVRATVAQAYAPSTGLRLPQAHRGDRRGYILLHSGRRVRYQYCDHQLNRRMYFIMPNNRIWSLERPEQPEDDDDWEDEEDC